MSEKLIRNNIAKIVLKNEGKSLDIRIASEQEALSMLKIKLVEEANEVLNSNTRDNFIEELADVLEVLKELISRNNIVEEVFEKRESKFKEKGGFDKNIVLIGSCKN